MQLEGVEFEWPFCPRKDGGVDDFSTLTAHSSSGGFTAHLMNPAQEHALGACANSTYGSLLCFPAQRGDRAQWSAMGRRRSALQLHAGGRGNMEFKDIWIRDLSHR
jgi:hypothetical protein